MNTLILNRDFRLPADGWYHLVPMGEFPHPSGVVQVVDREAVRAICNRFAQEQGRANFPGLLVDFDHFSDDPEKPTEAAGWVIGLQARDSGVWGQIRWSDAGEAAVKGGRYRLVSPVWLRRDCEALGNAQRLRPLRLHKVALTNDPNMKGMEPLSNRAGEEFRRGVSAPMAGSGKTNKTERTKMKNVATKLGLSAEASEDAVLEAVTKLLNRAEQAEAGLEPLNARVKALETENRALLEAQAEADLDKYANRIKPEKRAAWKGALLANRAQALELLEGLPEPEPPKNSPATATVLNRAQTKTPEGKAGVADPAAAALAAKIRNRAAQIAKDQNLSFSRAWELAKGEFAEANSR